MDDMRPMRLGPAELATLFLPAPPTPPRYPGAMSACTARAGDAGLASEAGGKAIPMSLDKGMVKCRASPLVFIYTLPRLVFAVKRQVWPLS